MSAKQDYTTDDLISMAPQHESLLCIDSDGCTFDTMDVKQKTCFHTLIILHWGLEPIETYVREAAEFVNLYSRWRGQNRFLGLITMFDFLRERREVIESGIEMPRLPALRKFIASGVPLGNPTLEKAVNETRDPELTFLLTWSKEVNRWVAEKVTDVPPFKWVRESLEKVKANSDAICTSQTPVEALVREWNQHGIAEYVSVIAGQELGTKGEHISLASRGKYDPENILMIGDALGDKKAARHNNALFYPINPAHEEESWERFCKEAYDKFLNHDYAGEYEQACIAEFEALLPETPPWK